MNYFWSNALCANRIKYMGAQVPGINPGTRSSIRIRSIAESSFRDSPEREWDVTKTFGNVA